MNDDTMMNSVAVSIEYLLAVFVCSKKLIICLQSCNRVAIKLNEKIITKSLSLINLHIYIHCSLDGKSIAVIIKNYCLHSASCQCICHSIFDFNPEVYIILNNGTQMILSLLYTVDNHFLLYVLVHIP